MKRISVFAVVCAVVLAAALPAMADWNPGSPAKWVQLPDLTPTGIDIDTDGCSIVADDFQCTSRNPITDVHVWSSWKQDFPCAVTAIRVQIYSDVSPVGAASHPSDILWTGVLKPAGAQGPSDGYFTDRLYFTLPQGSVEEFWKPNSTSAPDSWDTQVWQYNMFIDPAKAFIQQGSPTDPMTYWLELDMQIANPVSNDLGWKTRSLTDGHYKDAAVYWNTTQQAWLPLLRVTGAPIDMAFVLTTPEPSSIMALFVGMAGLGGLVMRRRR